jgi:hypothetical protein
VPASSRPRNAYAAPAWAAEQRVGDVATKATLLLLANYADEKFSCFPSQETIAEETEQSVSTVYRQLKRLENKLKLIRREKRYDSLGKRTSDRYILNLDLVVNVHETPSEQEEHLDVNLTGSESGEVVPGEEAPGDKDLDVNLTGSHYTSLVTGSESDYRSPETSTTGHSYDRGTPSRTPTYRSFGSIGDSPDFAPSRLDVERLCQRLAEKIEDNGSKRPKVTATWRDACRRLLDLDGRTEDQVQRAIDWCQADEFWQANVMSMPQLRKKYDTLRLQAQREQNGTSSTRRHRAYRDPEDNSGYYGKL